MSAERRGWLEFRIPPPVIGALVAGGMWALASLPPALPLPDGLRHGIAAVLLLAGLLFDLGGLVAFRRRRTTIHPLKPARASALVTEGVYRVTRNPMYLGMALLLTAWAVELGAAWPFAGPAAFVLYVDRFQIAPEERVLRGLFGADYNAYAARVRRWL